MERSTKQKVIEVLESNDSFIIALATPGETKGDVSVLFSASIHVPKFYVLGYLTAMIEDLQEKRNKFLLDFITDPAKNEK